MFQFVSFNRYIHELKDVWICGIETTVKLTVIIINIIRLYFDFFESVYREPIRMCASYTLIHYSHYTSIITILVD